MNSTSLYLVVICVGGLTQDVWHGNSGRTLPKTYRPPPSTSSATMPSLRATEEQADTARTFSGTIVMVEADHVTLSRKGQWTRFLVSPDAMISVNSAEAPLEEVAPGLLASIVGLNQGSHLVATVIDAKRQY